MLPIIDICFARWWQRSTDGPTSPSPMQSRRGWVNWSMGTQCLRELLPMRGVFSTGHLKPMHTYTWHSKPLVKLIMKHSAKGKMSRRTLSKHRSQISQFLCNHRHFDIRTVNAVVRIELITLLWARGIGRTSGTAGWVLVVLSIVKPLLPWMFIRLLFCRRTLPRRISWLKNAVLIHKSIQTHVPVIRRVLLSRCRVRNRSLRMPRTLLTSLF